MRFSMGAKEKTATNATQIVGEVRVIVCQKAISVRIEFPVLRKKNIPKKCTVHIAIAVANTWAACWSNFWVGCCDSRTVGVVVRWEKYSLGWALPLACDRSCVSWGRAWHGRKGRWGMAGNGSWQPIRPLPSNRALTFVHAQSTVRFNGKNEFHSMLCGFSSFGSRLLCGQQISMNAKIGWQPLRKTFNTASFFSPFSHWLQQIETPNRNWSYSHFSK